MTYSVLKISDGTNSVNLLDINRGFLLYNWKPSIAPFKGGGVWQSSPLTDGRRLAMRNFDNAIETFELKLQATDQDTAIDFVQYLVTLLEKAVAYWTATWQNEPVWIEARGPKETGSRYAIIKSYSIEGLGNPYTQPFFNVCNEIALDDFNLIVERDHWMESEPGQSTCVQTNTLQDVEDVQLNYYVQFSEAQSEDDLYINLDSSTGFTNNDRCWVGITVPDGWDAESGLRFPGITVPQGATIIDAYLEVVASSIGSDDDYDMEFVISGEDSNDAPIWGGYLTNLFDDYMYRKTNLGTSAVAVVNSRGDSWHTDTEVQYITGLGPVVQEIINRTGWSSGNAMAFFVGFNIHVTNFPPNQTDSRIFYSWDSAQTEPILHIVYLTAAPTQEGRESTCTGSTYVGNKHNYAQINYVFYKENGGGYSNNLILETKPTELLPVAGPVAGDIIYFGISTELVGKGPFDSLAFDLVDGLADGLVLAWYYYDSGTGNFAALSVYGNQNLNISGETLVWWEQPSTWTYNTINGVEAFWVKAVVTTGAADSPIQQNRNVYSIITPFLDVDSLQVPGEISALGRIRIFGQSYGNFGEFTASDVMISGRSKSRGDNFTPYLNYSTIQNAPGITLTPGWGVLTVDSTTPTGYSCQKTIAAISIDWAGMGNFSMGTDIAKEYRGVYHAYLRMKQVGGAIGDVYHKIRYWGFVGSSYTDTEAKTVDVTDASHLIDFGIIELGSKSSLSPTDYAVGSKIEVMYFQYTTDSIKTIYYDLILMPIDEWSGIYNTSEGGMALGIYNLLDVDALGSPRTPRAFLRWSSGSMNDDQVLGEWQRFSRGGPLLQSNSDQRIWFLFSSGETYKVSEFGNKYSVDVFRNSRYLTMRGSA